ncbi:sigma factor [Micromonospora sp. NPDC047187]|uniref:sigma factor n=1 Tax=Micromonospora sp. NPDC047187 TaxID=3155262 RepID=UPI0033C9AAFC
MTDSSGAESDDFVRSRSGVLLRVAFLLTGDRHAAEDLLQEVLEQMYVRWRRVQSSPQAYARRALVNRSSPCSPANIFRSKRWPARPRTGRHPYLCGYDCPTTRAFSWPPRGQR